MRIYEKTERLQNFYTSYMVQISQNGKISSSHKICAKLPAIPKM